MFLGSAPRPEGGFGTKAGGGGGGDEGDYDDDDDDDDDDDEEEDEDEDEEGGGLRPPGPPPGAPPPDVVPVGVIVQEYKMPKKSVRFAEGSDESDSDSEGGGGEEEASVGTGNSSASGVLSGAPSLSGMAPPMSLIQAPPLAPPGPPPMLFSRIPPGPPPGMPPPPSRFPPPPLGGPPGFNMAAMPRPLMPPNPNRPHIQSQAVLTAAPVKGKQPSSVSSKSMDAVISAQPLLRNMQAEVTKFMPTTLMVRRDQPKLNKTKVKPGQPAIPPRPMPAPTKGGGGMQGDAYEAFMKEMQGLL